MDATNSDKSTHGMKCMQPRDPKVQITIENMAKGTKLYLFLVFFLSGAAELPQFVGPCRRRVWSTSTPLCRIEPFTDSAVQTVNHRRSSVSGRSSTVLEQSAPQCYVSQFVVGFPAATETHTVPAVIPRHYRVTFLNCNTHSGLAVALLLRPL